MRAGKLFLLTLLCYLASSLHIHHASHHLVDEVRHQVAWDYYNSDNKPDKQNPNWLSNIADDKLISWLSIPGTHYSGTYDCRRNQDCKTNQCQSWTLYGQLMAGIRFLDISVMTDDNVIMVGHGSFKMIELLSLFSSVKSFLRKYTTQFVILSFQKESGEEQNTDQIKDLMQSYELIPVLTGLNIPTVGELRGKVWIVSGKGYDIPGTYPLYGRQEQTAADTPEAYMQKVSNYGIDMGLGKKLDLVMETAQKNCENNRLKVNQLSGSSEVLPFQLAKMDGGPNQVLDVWLRDNHAGCLGITIMDFPGTGLI